MHLTWCLKKCKPVNKLLLLVLLVVLVVVVMQALMRLLLLPHRCVTNAIV